MEDLKNRRALVTGAAVRIGRALALALAKEGCDLAIHYCSNKAAAEELAREIRDLGRQVVTIQADFRNLDSAKIVSEQVLAALGGLDILINNASSWPSPESLAANSGLLRDSLSSWEAAMAINARAPFFLIQNLAEALKQSGSGSIINILDESVDRPFTDRASHTISKAALASLTQVAAHTLLPDVRVNSLRLGAIIPAENLAKADLARRSWGGMEEVVRAVLFLIKAKFINGETVVVRGDRHLIRP